MKITHAAPLGFLFFVAGFTTFAADTAATKPHNIDDAFDAEITVDLQNVPLAHVFDQLRNITQTNLAINWPALAQAKINRDTRVTLRLHDVPYDAVVRSLLRVLAPPESGLNYFVDENALEITTNAALGSALEEHLYEVGPLLEKKMAGPATAEVIAQRTAALQTVLKTALRNAGEPVEGTGRTWAFKDGILAVTTSKRAHGLLHKLLTMIGSPVPIGALVPGTAESVRAKKTNDALKLLADPAGTLPLVSLAGGSSTLNVIVLPGAQAQMGWQPKRLDHLIDETGILEIGTPDEIARRVLPGVYDLSELLRRRSLRAHTSIEQELPSIVAALEAQVHATTWGPVGASLNSMTPYAQELIVFAPASVHREIAAALQTMYK
jgi:hypothetical protein